MHTTILNFMLFTFTYSIAFSQVDNSSANKERLSKEQAIKIVRHSRYYKNIWHWRVTAQLDTVENVWTITSRKGKHFRHYRKGKGEGIRKERVISIDAYTGKTNKKEKFRRYLHAE
jgi:hypothetical protein